MVPLLWKALEPFPAAECSHPLSSLLPHERDGEKGLMGTDLEIKRLCSPFFQNRAGMLLRRRHRVNPSAPEQTPSERKRLSHGFGGGEAHILEVGCPVPNTQL